MTDSRQLLADYARNHSEAVFRELVARYLDLVYSTAVRLVEGDAHRAEDVAQIVFADLAKMARGFEPEVMLGGWLHRHTCFVAANTLRGERRRRLRERQAVDMNLLTDNSGADFSRLAPLLDEAINELEDADRTAILLRFFEQKDFRSVGNSLDSSEDAARMRVNRALDKLRELLERRGVTTTAAALSVVLTASAVQAAPVGLVATISAAALAGTAVSTSTIIATTAKTIAMTTLQKTLVTATVAALVGAGIFEARQNSKLREQNQILQQQQAPLAEQIQQLQNTFADATNRLADLRAQNSQLQSNSNANELLKLRGEVTRLRALQMNSAVEKTDPFTQSVLALVSRAAELNQHLQQMPDKKIPELQLLNESDWLTAARTAQFDTDAGIRKALQKLRIIAKEKVPIGSALFSFARANNGQLPASLDQLKPYFDRSRLGDLGLDDSTFNAIVGRYTLLHTGNANDFPSNTWFVVETAPVDKDYDSRAKFGLGTSAVISTGIHDAGDPDDKSY